MECYDSHSVFWFYCLPTDYYDIIKRQGWDNWMTKLIGINIFTFLLIYGREQAPPYLSYSVCYNILGNILSHSPPWRHFCKLKLVNKPLTIKTADDLSDDVNTDFYWLWLKLQQSDLYPLPCLKKDIWWGIRKGKTLSTYKESKPGNKQTALHGHGLKDTHAQGETASGKISISNVYWFIALQNIVRLCASSCLAFPRGKRGDRAMFQAFLWLLWLCLKSFIYSITISGIL